MQLIAEVADASSPADWSNGARQNLATMRAHVAALEKEFMVVHSEAEYRKLLELETADIQSFDECTRRGVETVTRTTTESRISQKTHKRKEVQVVALEADWPSMRTDERFLLNSCDWPEWQTR